MTNPSTAVFQTKQRADHADYTAPDGSKIRLLAEGLGGGLSHCTLPKRRVSKAVAHKTVEEIWYCICGHGQVWRKLGDAELTIDVSPGSSLTIPKGTVFQFAIRAMRHFASSLPQCHAGLVPRKPYHNQGSGKWPKFSRSNKLTDDDAYQTYPSTDSKS